MIVAGDYVFNEMNVAFHFIRRSVWEPWETIGIYVTCNTMARCRYLPKYKRIQDEFDHEVKEAVRLIIAGSREFLNKWRADHQDVLSVICPIINYCTTEKNSYTTLSYLYTRYVGSSSPKYFARLTLMLKQRERHFAVMMSPKWLNVEIKDALREAKLI